MIETYFKVVIDEETEAENIQSRNGEIYTEISGMCDKLNQLSKENEQLKKENHEYKALLQDMGLLLSDNDVISIRNDIANELIKPLLKENGFNVDVDTTDGFTIIPKGDVE